MSNFEHGPCGLLMVAPSSTSSPQISVCEFHMYRKSPKDRRHRPANSLPCLETTCWPSWPVRASSHGYPWILTQVTNPWILASGHRFLVKFCHTIEFHHDHTSWFFSRNIRVLSDVWVPPCSPSKNPMVCIGLSSCSMKLIIIFQQKSHGKWPFLRLQSPVRSVCLGDLWGSLGHPPLLGSWPRLRIAGEAAGGSSQRRPGPAMGNSRWGNRGKKGMSMGINWDRIG